MIEPKKILSFCIPTYNRACYIERCIESIIGYPYNDIEVVVKDNCSTDNTEEIVKSYSDSRIKFHKNSSNISMLLNIRTIIDFADGKYCFFLTDDDILIPGAIYIIKDFIFKNNPSVFKSDSIVYLEKSKKSYVYSAIQKTKSNNDLSYKERAEIILFSHVLTGLCFKKTEVDFNFYDNNIDLWYPSMLITGMLSNNMGYLAKPLTIHTWENEIFWGVPYKSKEVIDSTTKGILILQSKIEKELFKILLKKYIISSGLHTSNLFCYFSFYGRIMFIYKIMMKRVKVFFLKIISY